MPRKKQNISPGQVASEVLENGKIITSTKRLRKAQESFKSTLSKILSLKIAPGTVSESVLKTPLGENITYQEAILIAQILKATGGDTQSATFLRDTSGNKLKEKEEIKATSKKFEDF
jgi:hypothetical protein